jgi:ATP-dependent Clp protease protease subunit
MMREPTWQDEVRNRLLNQRVVTLDGALDDMKVSDIAATMWSLDALGDEPISPLFSSCRGSIETSLALIDVIEIVGVQVRATSLGVITGAPIAVFAAAQHRRATPHARFVFSEHRMEVSGSYHRLRQAADAHLSARAAMIEHLASSTRGRRSVELVTEDFDAQRTLDAEAAKAYGIVDEVVSAPRQIIDLGRRQMGLGFRRD